MLTIKKIKNFYAELSIPAKATLAYLLVSILQKSLSFLTSPIFTRILSQAEYGQVAVYFSWQEVIGILAMFCLQGGVFNNGMIDYAEKRDEYSFSMLILSNVITILVGICGFIVFGFTGNILNIKTPLLLLMFIYFITQPAMGFWTTRQRYEYKYKMTCIVTLISCFAAPIISIICVSLFKEHAVYARLYGYTLTLVAFYVVFYFILAKKSHYKVDVSYWKYALKFNVVLIPHYLSTYILNSSDRIMISKLISDSAAGMYSLAYSISAILTAIWVAINNSLIPFTYENCKKKNYSRIGKITLLIVIAFFGCSLGLTLIAPELLKILSTSEYTEAIYVLPSIIMGVFFQAMYFIFANIVYYYKKPTYVMMGSVLSAICNILLNYMLIPKYGFIAAGYTTMFSYILQAAIDYFAMKRVAQVNIYNMKILILITVIAIVCAILCPIIYKGWIIRYLIVVVLSVLVVINRKNVMNALQEIRNK